MSIANKGRTAQAKIAYRDAQELLTQAGEPAGEALAQTDLASLSVFAGQLGEAASYLNKARASAHNSPISQQVLPAILLVEGHLLLTQGDFTQAEARYSDAHNQAEGQQEPLIASQALLGMARTRLATWRP